MHGNNFYNMTMLLRQQREIMYQQRYEVMESENLRDIVEKMIRICH